MQKKYLQLILFSLYCMIALTDRCMAAVTHDNVSRRQAHEQAHGQAPKMDCAGNEIYVNMISGWYTLTYVDCHGNSHTISPREIDVKDAGVGTDIKIYLWGGGSWANLTSNEKVHRGFNGFDCKLGEPPTCQRFIIPPR